MESWKVTMEEKYGNNLMGWDNIGESWENIMGKSWDSNGIVMG